MNETVKAALLRMRERVRSRIRLVSDDVASLQRKLDVSQSNLDHERGCLADIELHLRDNGVDLAAVDAEAVKVKPSALSTGLTQGYDQIGRNAAMQSWAAQNGGPLVPSDAIMGGLAKALDEA